MKTPETNSNTNMAFRLLRLFCPPELLEEIEGDLLQRYQRDLSAAHDSNPPNEPQLRKAKRKLLWNTLRFFRPEIILRNKIRLQPTNYAMLRNHILIAFRNFARQKSYTLLNIIGLSLGMAASLLIIQYVKYERSFDTFHARAHDIYRIQYNGWQNGKLNYESAVAVPAAPAALKENFPEVEAYTRLLPVGGVLQYQQPGEEPVSFREEKAFYADTSFFNIFDFRILAGNGAACLKGVNKIVVSASFAKRYFGNEEVLGKQLLFNGNTLVEVTGVFADVPENSHIKFDFLLSYETINKETEDQSATSWGWYDFYSFVLLKPGTNVQALQAKWDEYLVKTRKEDWDKYNRKQEFILRPLTSIHLHSKLLYETSPEELRDGDSVYALSFIALFILIIAWVNYVNLATARSLNRASEVGVRKVVGAFRSQLVGQFTIESLILNIIAALIALGLVISLWSPFSHLTGWQIPFDYLLQPSFWWLVVALFLLGALLSGLYPAVVLSSFKPVAVLKGKLIRSASGNYFRKGLVIFQFAASAFLISGSLIVYQQLQFMKNKELGVNLSQTLILKGPEVVTDSLYEKSVEAFRTEVQRVPGIKGISGSSNIPGVENYWTMGVRRLQGGPEGFNTMTHISFDYDFIPQYQIKVLAGRAFDRQFTSDEKAVIINRAAAEDLDYADPAAAIGEVLISNRDTLKIVGVIDNFHQMSLKTAIIPLVCRLWPYSGRFYSLKLETTDYKKTVAAIEEKWDLFFPGNPLDYFFIDQFFNRQYVKDDRFGQVFTLFTGLAIFIASLGLLGLASFMTTQRTREIGIRKVLGSTASGIVVLLSKEFMQPVLISIALAAPLGWWLMSRWLQNFPYRTDIPLWTFIASGVMVMLIALLSVSSQTLKAALSKPADTLKYE
jgi:putative ABC transport system permease protein